MLKEYHIGIDDTDSHEGMCTTYLATLIVDSLENHGVEFLDFPKLVRLNPNIPYKTRGNGAVSISFISTTHKIEEIWKECINLVKIHSDIKAENTDPGIVLQIGKPDPRTKKVYYEALYTVISLKSMQHILNNNFQGLYYSIKEGRGLIGACAAIGANLYSDYTYEFIAYRDPSIKTSKRMIDEKSVIEADQSNPLSFGNYDYVHNQLMITPHGPDPVYVGIRGETAKSVIQMWNEIKILENITTVMLFRSNQHTQPHFPKEFTGKDIKPYYSVKVRGVVDSTPHLITGGHVIVSIVSNGKTVNCAAYEPTKKFRKHVRELIAGDELMVYGGVRPASDEYPITINLEQFEIIKLQQQIARIPLKCPHCEGALKSLGQNQGFRCKRCKYQIDKKEIGFQFKKRGLHSGVRYVIPTCAQRHLTKPTSRDDNLQFHLPSEESFQEEFHDFLKNRENLLKHPLI
ncbi:tRNA(Ile2) 2-agmatinylcytidine synthetase [Candidatus Heimdallarchaeota archaeon B3_Heim]|nr:MAG: tRNA(Ile2) 2-agmatinylcytidine synthetase [Candidatus Heimdallarchaeota archaeon B3_Heim]